MNKRLFLWLALILSLITTWQACKHTALDNTNLKDFNMQSKNGDDESKGMENACLDCHTQGNRGKGLMTLAGSVYTSPNGNTKLRNGKVMLYDSIAGGGRLLKTIEMDDLGNFYSDAKYNFSYPIYPVVMSSDGKTKYMSTPVPHGNCNACHGVSTNKIYVN